MGDTSQSVINRSSAIDNTAYTNANDSSDFSSIHTFFEKKAAPQRNHSNYHFKRNSEEFINYEKPAIIMQKAGTPYETNLATQSPQGGASNQILHSEPAVNSHRDWHNNQ